MPLRTMLGILAWLSMAVPCAAHHSFVVEYDVNRPLKLKGVVTKVEWSNPHARLSVAVVDANGATTTWHFELASPNVLERNGWTRWTLNVGDRISVEGYGGFAMPARGTVRSITTPDGRTLVPGDGQEVRDSPPGRSFKAATFGRILSQSGGPRIMQFGVKYGFQD
jgi:hypothetical protein